MVHPQRSAQQVLSNISTTAQQTEPLSSRADLSVRSDRLPALRKFAFPPWNAVHHDGTVLMGAEVCGGPAVTERLVCMALTFDTDRILSGV
jgi:hypothetical protein